MTERATTRHWPPLLVVGVTGGIASGKSTVTGMFAELGATVLNADREGHAVIAPGEPALAELVAEFGAEYLLESGDLDRKKLGGRVFGDPKALAALNRITHPRIRRRLEERLAVLAANPPQPPVVLVEAALLVEAGWRTLVDRLLVVTAQPSTQARRLIAGLGLSEAEASARIAAQLPASDRIRHADHHLDGEHPLPELRRDVHDLWRTLIELAAIRPL